MKGSSFRKRGRVVLLVISLAACVPGCFSWQAADGTRHTLVVGIGLVSTKEAPDQSATALRSQTLGLALRPPQGGLVLGYQSLQMTSIHPNWQGLAQVSAGPGQPLTVAGSGPAAPNSSPIPTAAKGETP